MISQLTRYNYFILVFIIKIIVITFNIAHISVTNIHKQICIHTYTYTIKYVQANIMFKNTILCTHKHTSAWTQKHLCKHMYLYTCTYTQIINAHKKTLSWDNIPRIWWFQDNELCKWWSRDNERKSWSRENKLRMPRKRTS